MSTRTLGVGIAGLGTVGSAVLGLLQRDAALLQARTGIALTPLAVAARDRWRERGVDLKGLRWHEDLRALADDPEVDVVVELIGGADGPALDLAMRALQAGKSVVTANKAMLAHHGRELASTAERNAVSIAYEAAAAGGIPIVKSLREGLAANRITRIYGILNGTCNYILSTMRRTGREFADVLREAQTLGYAEADPSFDVDGIDTAHKLALLAALAFGTLPRFDAVHTEGIRHVSALDIAYAEELGYRIKLLGIARQTSRGLEQSVHPCMVPVNSAIAQVEGADNAINVEGHEVGTVVHEGRGAGGGPTASAVVADLVDLALGQRRPTFGVPFERLIEPEIAPLTSHAGSYYIRLMVVDRPGVLADVSAVLRDHHVSIEALIQRARNPNQPVPIVLTSHQVEEASMTSALAEIALLPTVLEPPRMIRVISFD